MFKLTINIKDKHYLFLTMITHIDQLIATKTIVAKTITTNSTMQSHSFFGHHKDCDTVYAHSPIEKAVCNTSETHNFLPDVRTCLQQHQAHGDGFIVRHYDCFRDHFNNNSFIF